MKDELTYESQIERSKLEVKKFSWSDILPEKVRKCKHVRFQTMSTQRKIKSNSEAYIHWILGILAGYVPTPPKGKKWSAVCLYMNPKNINYLDTQIDSIIWLDIAPTCCTELTDDEYGVDPTGVVVALL